MILAIDAHYRKDGSARFAGVTFYRWKDLKPAGEIVIETTNAAAYESGSFYKRELPGILALLENCTDKPDSIVVDGYVWLGERRPGMGAHLWNALKRSTPVIGVAKSLFRGAPAVKVYRGDSRRPLYITSAGMPVEEASEYIASMNGTHRIPSLLRHVDRLARK